VLGCATTYADEFETKQDLIDACMASAHVPFVLDWQPFAFYRHFLRFFSTYLICHDSIKLVAFG
jgi:hypothetical protein